MDTDHVEFLLLCFVEDGAAALARRCEGPILHQGQIRCVDVFRLVLKLRPRPSSLHHILAFSLLKQALVRKSSNHYL